MSAIPLRQPKNTDWQTILSEIGPLIAEEGRLCDVAHTYVAKNMAMLRERGFLELAVPTELGGAGLTRIELAAMLRSLAHYCSATALTLAMHTHVVAAAAWRWKHQKAPTDGMLKKVAADRIQLLSSGGSDWLKGGGDAVRVEGGYRVNARKIFASGAKSANLYMTTAVSQEADGPTVLHFGLPMNTQGVSIVETWDALGMRGSGSHDVALEDVFVPDAAVGGKRKSGPWHPLMHVVSLVAFPLIYSVYTGVAEALRDAAVTAVKNKANADTIDAVGRLDTELAATRIAFDSMVAFAETASIGPETTNTIFMHRSLVVRSVLATADLALTAAGGGSYLRRSGIERLFRDVQAARFHPIPEGQQRRMAGRLALGMPIDD